LKSIKYKQSWKTPGLGNNEFSPINALKGEVLNPWKLSRVTMPLRSFERYPVKETLKFRLKGENFGYDYSSNNLSNQYVNFLKDHNEKFKVSIYKYTIILKFFKRRTTYKDQANMKNKKNFCRRFYRIGLHFMLSMLTI
jgi:hypothetical protein